MGNTPHEALSREDCEQIGSSVRACAEQGDLEGAWSAARPLLDRQASDENADQWLVWLVRQESFSRERGLEILREAVEAHGRDNPEFFCRIGQALGAVWDRRYLNDPPPSDPLFAAVATRLREMASRHAPAEVEQLIQVALAIAARILGRTWDATTEKAARRLVELQGDRWEFHYDLGLFLKNRGRFAEGVEANLQARALGGADDEALQ